MGARSGFPHLLLIPFKDKGHIAPMLILAKQLLQESLSITLISLDSESHSTITSSGTSNQMNVILLDQKVREQTEEEALGSLLSSLKLSDPPPAAVLVDVILSWTMAPIQNSGIPRYVLYTASCTNLSAMFELKPRIQIQSPEDRSRDHDPSREDHRRRHRNHDSAPRLLQSRAVLVNSAVELEARELEFIRSKTGKQILAVGPLLEYSVESSLHPCMTWLDQQMPGSVIFIGFGSRTYLKREQIREIAAGLERSGQGFLWLLPVPADFENNEEEYLKSVLCESFRERVNSTGVIITDWAPQKLILEHGAVAAFLTHCGWNSVLECLCLGAKPMLCLPCKADQPVNCRFIVDELRVGLELETDDETGIARSEQIERKIRAVVGEEGQRMKEVLKKLQVDLNGATKGSSLENVREFAKQVSELVK